MIRIAWQDATSAAELSALKLLLLHIFRIPGTHTPNPEQELVKKYQTDTF